MTVIDPEAIQIATMVAVLLVPVVSAIKKPSWPSQAKYALGLAAAFIATIIGAFAAGDLHSFSDLVASFGVAFTAAQSIYNMYFNSTTVNAALERLGVKKPVVVAPVEPVVAPVVTPPTKTTRAPKSNGTKG